MRILFTSYPVYGHVNTLLPLARQAMWSGHEVAFATGPDLVREIQRRGLDAWLVGPSRAEAHTAFRATHPDLDSIPPDQRLLRASADLFVETALARAVELIPRAQEWKPDIVVHELSEFAGALAAARTGARHAVHGLGLRPPARLWESIFGPGMERLSREWQLPEFAKGLMSATYLDICPRSLRTDRPDDEPAWRRSQPLRPAVGEPALGERLPVAIAALPRLQTIHLTLGTVFHETPGVLETAIAALRELPLNLVVTCGPGTDPARFGPQPPHVLIEPYIPHALLLPHCRLVVSHGGAGIMLGALAHGLPQLILPLDADQFLNAAACQSAGVALVLGPDERSHDAVAAAVERLIVEPRFRTAAGRIRAEIDAMPAAVDVLIRLAASEAIPAT